MADYRENQRFTEKLIGEYLLDEAIEWMQKNLSVIEVFDKEEILDYAKDEGYIHEENAVDYVREMCNPEDVFSVTVLNEWAENNGWVEG